MSLSLTGILFLSLAMSFTLSLTRTLFLSLAMSLTRTLFLSLAMSFTLSLTRTLSLSLFLALAASAVANAAPPEEPDEPGAPRPTTSAAVRRSERALVMAPAPASAARDRRILRHKEREVEALRALLAGPGGPGGPGGTGGPGPAREERLLRQAQLELEVAILHASLGEAADWEGPALTAQRALVESPSSRGADRVRYFLAQLELRRGRLQVALAHLTELAQKHPRSPLRCDAWLLAGETRLGLGDRDTATDRYQQVLGDSGCGAEVQQRARYKLAWALLGARRAAAAARELRTLLRGSLRPALRERVLKDLLLAWSMSTPDKDAVQLLVAQGGASGQALVEELARLLLAERRLEALLAVTGAFLEHHGRRPAAGSEEARALRLRAVAQLGTASALEREIAAHERAGRTTRRLREAAAQALLDLAQRCSAGPAADPRQARELLARVVRAYAETPQAGSARYHLGEALLAAGDLAGAAQHHEVAANAAPGPLRARAAYRLVDVLERLLSRAAPQTRPSLRERFSRAAWRFVTEHPTSAERPDVLLALAGQLAVADSHDGAARAAELFLSGYPVHPRRGDAVTVALYALERARRPERAYELAVAELTARRPQLGTAGPPGEAALRLAAARAALRQSSVLLEAGDSAAAAKWAMRATQMRPSGKAGDDVALAAAALAARAGQTERAEQIYGVAIARGGAIRPRALVGLAELQESRGQLAAAATLYIAASGVPEAAIALRARWLARAASAQVAAGDRPAARATTRTLARLVEGGRWSGAEALRWQLTVGRLLAEAGGAAVSHFRRLAHQIERDQPRSAARFLVRAAAAAPPGQARRLYEAALSLAGLLRRQGRVVDEAAEARLGLARLALGRALELPVASAGAARRRLVLLQETQASLLELLAAGDRRWSSAAGSLVASIQEQQARVIEGAPWPADLHQGERERYRAAVAARAAELRRLRTTILERLAATARQSAGLDASTLAAASALAPPGMPALRADHLPDATPETAALLELARAGRVRAVRVAAARGLALRGLRDDLLCLRGVGRLAHGEAGLAAQDWEQALKLAPRSRCARLNLATLAIWTRDYARAERLLAGLNGEPALLGRAAAALGSGRHHDAARLARAALAENPRSSGATCLLGTLLADHLGDPEAAAPWVRACADDKAGARATVSSHVE